MAEDFDPSALVRWQDDLAVHLGRLPDPKLAADLQKTISARLRAGLTVGDGAPLKVLTADQILTTEWPPPVWAVPGLLPAGLCILAGKAKLGKSWLALQLAAAVASGGVALGRQVERGPVLYLALEDIPESLQSRMKQQRWPPGLHVDFIPLGDFARQVGDLRNGGGERLARQIEAVGYRLVVVDTLSRAVSGDQNDVAVMTAALSPLQEIALSNNCTAVLTDHHNKLGSGDALGDILGSTGKGAVADTLWGLYRERGKAGGKLAILGRRVPDQTLEITFDGLTGCWQAGESTDGLKMTEAREKILDSLEDLGRCELTDIAEATGRNRGSVYRDLQDLVNAGLVSKMGNSYGLARLQE